MTGRVVEVKRFAVHDGPGIRTTFFLKGCPLACVWCHNPETISPKPEIGFVRNKCVGCGTCVDACPTGAHRMGPNGHTFDRGSCAACGACVEACLPGALELYGQETTAEEAVAIALEDRTFYQESQGGVTFSGGEPLLQAEFCATVCARLQGEGIHCAIDTCGAVPWKRFETVLPQVDMFLYDLKHIDSERHRTLTGRGNERILANLRQLSATGRPIEIRLPLVPGLNDSPADLLALGDYLVRLPVVPPVRILPYHSWARSKYEALGRTDTMPRVAPPEQEHIARATSILLESGVSPLI